MPLVLSKNQIEETNDSLILEGEARSCKRETMPKWFRQPKRSLWLHRTSKQETIPHS